MGQPRLWVLQIGKQMGCPRFPPRWGTPDDMLQNGSKMWHSIFSPIGSQIGHPRFPARWGFQDWLSKGGAQNWLLDGTSQIDSHIGVPKFTSILAPREPPSAGHRLAPKWGHHRLALGWIAQVGGTPDWLSDGCLILAQMGTKYWVSKMGGLL